MTHEDDSDRRRGERVPINAEFGCLANETTYVSDLSEHGVFVHTQQLLSIGTKIELRFTVVLDDPVVIQGLGTVVRLSQDPPGLGIEFGPLSPETVLRINDAVGRKRPRDIGQPLRPVAGMPASDVAARKLTEAEFDDMATGTFPAIGRPADGPDGEKTHAGVAATDDGEVDTVEVPRPEESEFDTVEVQRSFESEVDQDDAEPAGAGEREAPSPGHDDGEETERAAGPSADDEGV